MLGKDFIRLLDTRKLFDEIQSLLVVADEEGFPDVTLILEGLDSSLRALVCIL